MNKEKYKEILDYLKEDLNSLHNNLRSLLFKNKTELSKKTEAFLFSKAKRLRPIIIFLIRHMVSNETMPDKIINLAAAVELLHCATLLHDDIIDEAPLRRGLKTFNIEFNPKIATLSGDYLLALSLKELSKLNNSKVFEIFSNQTLEICTGEINEFFQKNKLISIEEYIEKSKKKTSALFVAAIEALFLITDVPVKIQKPLLDFTADFSLAFQIYDDIENFREDNKEKISSDFKQGIYTLPYLYLFKENKGDIINDENFKNDKLFNSALKFSNEYLDKTLTRAVNNLKILEEVYNSDKLYKLAEIFKTK